MRIRVICCFGGHSVCSSPPQRRERQAVISVWPGVTVSGRWLGALSGGRGRGLLAPVLVQCCFSWSRIMRRCAARLSPFKSEPGSNTPSLNCAVLGLKRNPQQCSAGWIARRGCAVQKHCVTGEKQNRLCWTACAEKRRSSPPSKGDSADNTRYHLLTLSHTLEQMQSGFSTQAGERA